MKPPLKTAILWLALFCLMFVLTAPLTQTLFILFAPIPWVFLLAGGVIFILALVTLRQDAVRSSTVLAICFTGFLLYGSNAGFSWGRYVLFQFRKPAYLEQLAEAERLGEVAAGFGVTHEGPPKIHGFYWQRGILDNWSAVVHDPSGRIAEINRADGMSKVHAHELSELFGGTFYSCQDVGGGWYICWFT